jgi:hypothetical protein
LGGSIAGASRTGRAETPAIESTIRKDELMMCTLGGLLRSRRTTSQAGTWRFLLAALTAIVWAASGQPAAGAEALSWKFKAGETLRYTMVQETTQGMKAMGQEFKTNMNQTVNLHWTVKNVASDGSAELSQTIDRVRTKVDAPGNSFEFDSESGKVPEGQIASLMTPMLKSLVGAEFTFKMNGRGELSDVKVPQKLLDSLRQAGPQAAAGGMFSEEGLKNLISQSSIALPGESVDKGKTWKQASRLPLPMIGTMVMDKIYTFEGPDEKAPGLLRISLNTKVALEPAADSNIAVKISSQKGEGAISFDPQAGRIVSSRVNDKLQMMLSVMGQELQQTTETLTSMTLGAGGDSK